MVLFQGRNHNVEMDAQNYDISLDLFHRVIKGLNVLTRGSVNLRCSDN